MYTGGSNKNVEIMVRKVSWDKVLHLYTNLCDTVAQIENLIFLQLFLEELESIVKYDLSLSL